jgi:hypothetical protein
MIELERYENGELKNNRRKRSEKFYIGKYMKMRNTQEGIMAW